MNWWLFSCIASAVFALVIGGVLIAFWLADRKEADPFAEPHNDCPWPLKERF